MVKTNLKGQNNKSRNAQIQWMFRSSIALLDYLNLLSAPRNYVFSIARDDGGFEGVVAVNQWFNKQSINRGAIPSWNFILDGYVGRPRCDYGIAQILALEKTSINKVSETF